MLPFSYSNLGFRLCAFGAISLKHNDVTSAIPICYKKRNLYNQKKLEQNRIRALLGVIALSYVRQRARHILPVSYPRLLADTLYLDPALRHLVELLTHLGATLS